MAGNGGAPVSDQRFQKVHNDPRFARNSKRKGKLQIDKRFAAVLHDDRFKGVQGKYDKYGRRIEKQDNQLKKFYQLEDDNEEEASDEEVVAASKSAKAAAKKKADEDDMSSTTSSDDDEASATVEKNDEKLSRLEYLNRMARGELGSGSSSSESDSDEESEGDSDVDELAEGGVEKEDIPMGEETKRFAVINCDWTRIRAVDLFALCQSFAPATGAVQNVTIYPSDYGLQKMKEEEQYGPQGLWEENEGGDAKSKAEDEDDSGDEEEKAPQDDGISGDNDTGDEEEEGSDGEKASSADEDDEDDADDQGYDSDDPLGVKKSVTLEDDMDGFDREKLRKYELQKLKYYYAVVSCDSVKTASAIFDQCDQLEYETSANVLDLRFVPEDVEFTNAPKESCDALPESYKPSIFATTALQNTEVKLTWEEDDQERMELLTRHSEWKDANDDDFSAYLASDVSSGEEGGEGSEAESGDDEDSVETSNGKRKQDTKLKKLKNRYRKMLLGSDAEDEDSDHNGTGSGSDADSDDGANGDSDADDGEGDMEMSFTPGASDILRAKKQRELEANETPFERYAREKKQQKNLKQHEKRTRQKQLAREQKEVLKRKGKSLPNEVKLLREAVDGDSDDGGSGGEGGDRNFDMKKIARQEKAQKLKGKRKAKEMKKLQKKSGLQEGFAFDAADPRFSALYASGSQFQLDPTDPKFKKTDATQAIFTERRKRIDHHTEVDSTAASTSTPATKPASGKTELKSMVENLKRKSKQQEDAKKKKASKKQRF